MRGVLPERRPELRTLSVQTGMELLQLLLQEARPAGRGGTLAAAVAGASAGAGGRAPLQATQWRELDPRALMEDAATDHVPNGAGEQLPDGELQTRSIRRNNCLV
ncbi:Protein of unknown function [Gryllus bimaculatus]|nr:Protein of unknown function [Gryllus bimaculatus]